MVATALKGLPGLLGYDLRNEPLTGANDGSGPACTWGDGGTNDIRQMYETVGNAIHAIDPAPIIFVEGVQNYTGENFAGTYGGNAPEGDLSMVVTGKAPVNLTTPNRVAYSVHVYPPGTNTAEWMANWAGVYQNNIAPLWIGECGDTMVQSSDISWGNVFVPFCNGTYSGGITVAPGQQGIGTTWFTWAANQGSGTPFAVTTSLVEPAQIQSAEAPFIQALRFTGTTVTSSAPASGAVTPIPVTGTS